MSETLISEPEIDRTPNHSDGNTRLVKRRKKSSSDRVRLRIDMDASLLPLLNKETFLVLFQLLNFLQREAKKSVVNASYLEVRGSVDPEDDTAQVIIRLWVAGSSADAMQKDFRVLCGEVSDWVSLMNEQERQVFTEWMSLQVRAIPNAKAV